MAETPPAPRASAPHRGRGVALALGATFWAALFLVPYQAAVERAPRGSVMAAMLLCAATFNQLVALITEGKGALRFGDRGPALVGVLTLGTVLGNGAIATALPSIGPGMTSVVMKAQVLLTPTLSIWLLSERASPRLWVGAALALAGFAIPQALEGGARGLDVGYLWALVAAAVFATIQVMTRRWIHAVRVAPVNALRLWLSAGLLLALPTAWGGGTLDLEPEVWGLAAAAGVAGPGISRLCLMNAVRYVTASTTALLSLVGPLFAFALGAAAFGEVPSMAEGVGAVLILAGILWPMLERRGA